MAGASVLRAIEVMRVWDADVQKCFGNMQIVPDVDGLRVFIHWENQKIHVSVLVKHEADHAIVGICPVDENDHALETAIIAAMDASRRHDIFSEWKYPLVGDGELAVDVVLRMLNTFK